MNFNDYIDLNTYSDSANEQFEKMQSRLFEIEETFNKRMNGKTKEGILATLLGLFVWVVVIVSGAVYLIGKANYTFLMISLITALVLVVLMIIDNITDYSYYGEISSYKDSISSLQNRVRISANSIRPNYNAFMKSKTDGWNYKLNVMPSILDEALKVSSTLANLETLKKGYISKAVDYLYYTTVIIFTVAGSLALFPVSSRGIKSISGSTIGFINPLALAITVIGMFVFAKYIWSKTNCSVTIKTLFVIPMGPVVFITVVALVTVLVILAAGVFTIGVIVITVGVIISALLQSTSGGVL